MMDGVDGGCAWRETIRARQFRCTKRGASPKNPATTVLSAASLQSMCSRPTWKPEFVKSVACEISSKCLGKSGCQTFENQFPGSGFISRASEGGRFGRLLYYLLSFCRFSA